MGLSRNTQPEDLTKEQLCKLAREVTKDSFRVYEENELLLAENKRLRENLDAILNIAALAINPNLANDIKQVLKQPDKESDHEVS